jgi:mRNA interferase YafQ
MKGGGKTSLLIDQSKVFRKDVRSCEDRGLAMDELKSVIRRLSQREKLDPKHRDHKLSGDYHRYRECHVQPDWLLIYRIDGQVLYLARTGTHADLY